MNFFKTIFARAWASWGIVSFVITFLIFFLPSMGAKVFKNEVRGQRYFIKVSEIWMRLWLFLIACPLKIKGRQNFVKGENYVIVYNHNALLDVPLSAPFVQAANKTIAKASFAKVPLFGAFYKQGSVLVDREDDRSRKKSFDAMKKVLAMGMHMCIYPEGTRNRSDLPMKKFYDGAFKLAADAGKDVMPCVIKGTNKAMPIAKSFYLLPTRLTMHFLPPVETSREPVSVIKDKVYAVMVEEFLKK